MTPDGNKGYIANFGPVGLTPEPPAQSVTVLNTRTGETIGEIGVGKQPTAVTLSHNGDAVYVVNSGTISDPGSVSVISSRTDEVVHTISGLSNPAGIAISPDDRVAYVTNQAEGTVSVIDTRTAEVLDSVTLPQEGLYPTNITVSPDGANVFVAGNLTGNIVVLNGHDIKEKAQTVKLPGYGMPQGLALTPDGKQLYVTEAASNEVAVVDVRTMEADAKTIEVGRNPSSVAFSVDGRFAYVTSSLDDPRGLSIIDTQNQKVIRSLNTGSGPFAVAVVSH
ncbi:beta-propeller fold lactonase family protein [Streptomyces sp. NPDC057910]|uniref:beta-propeller fold lactonase family protein n=1 Tax=Streptomyces sp. NPDC057910 TaxID=3346278 RepID=UPI0036EFC733